MDKKPNYDQLRSSRNVEMRLGGLVFSRRQTFLISLLSEPGTAQISIKKLRVCSIKEVFKSRGLDEII